MIPLPDIEKTKDFIFSHGRLLEKKLFEYFFEKGTRNSCIKALVAYQNPDGGFGNGIEPDLLCPESTAIGAETALYILDILECHDLAIVDNVVTWIVANQNEEGFISHPPKSLYDYPHQPWWENPDDARIFVLAGILKKWGVKNAHLFKTVHEYYSTVTLPDEITFYDYPYFVYLKYCSKTQKDKQIFLNMVDQIPGILQDQRDHFPLFSRYWFYAADSCKKVLEREAHIMLDAFQEDGGLLTPYPDLPWWRPIFTVDALILLKKLGM
ncbi:MAG: hypothetical protein PVF58_07115 [Candidatus Methanofastidiosia archaeon]|jgi:hypothetical protein